MKYTDVLAAYLKEDPRVEELPVYREVLFSTEDYEVSTLIYAAKGAFRQELVTFLVTYKHENLRILAKHISVSTGPNYAQYVAKILRPELDARDITPMQLVRDAKRWTKMPFTQDDRAKILGAGLDVN